MKSNIKKSQETTFKKIEADNWFIRNKGAISTKSALQNDLALELLTDNNIKYKKVIEVGCSTGYRLENIRTRYKANCFGVDPSARAIRFGKKLYPKLNLKKGVMSKLAFEDQTFDLIIINYVFHWIDRDTLFNSIKEVDRVLKKGGYIVIVDFLPKEATKVPYSHIKDGSVFTYKMNYANVFLATNNYKIIDKVVAKHMYPNIRDDKKIADYERIGAFVLKKEEMFNLSKLPPKV